MTALPPRWLLRLAALCAAAGLAAGCGAAKQADEPPATTGAEPLYVAAMGDDAGDCTRDDPCSTLDYAYAVAAPGQEVELAAGTYPAQTIRARPERPRGAAVVFRPAPGAAVSLGEVDVYATDLELRDLHVTGVKTHESAANVTVRDVRNTAGLFVLSSSKVRVLGGSVGGGTDYHPMIAAETATPPRNVLIDGVLFHDWTRTAPDVHTECLQIGAGVGITIRNSRFRNCDVFALTVTAFGDAGAPRDLTIERNVFDRGGDGGFFSVLFSEFAPVWRDVLVRGNSALQPIGVDPRPKKVNFRMIGNVAPLMQNGCVAGIVYAHNTWDGARCGATDVDAPPPARPR